MTTSSAKCSIGMVAFGLLLAACARSMEPVVLTGATESRAVILSAPDRGWKDTAQAHCSQHDRTAQVKNVRKPDPPPLTVKRYLGSSDMGPNKLYYIDCVE